MAFSFKFSIGNLTAFGRLLSSSVWRFQRLLSTTVRQLLRVLGFGENWEKTPIDPRLGWGHRSNTVIHGTRTINLYTDNFSWRCFENRSWCISNKGIGWWDVIFYSCIPEIYNNLLVVKIAFPMILTSFPHCLYLLAPYLLLYLYLLAPYILAPSLLAPSLLSPSLIAPFLLSPISHLLPS